jgi:hypothetical protein
LEITKEDDSLEPIKRILNKTDIAILDWQMHGDSGNKAIELLLSILDNSQKAELRLIIIYTEEQTYASILPDIILPRLLDIDIKNGILDKSNCKYLNGHTKIVVLKKENGIKTDFSVSDEELPERIIEEFTDITEGLVSNTALKAVSTVRRNTHNLLAIFNKDLDAAFFNHRAFLETPSDSQLHVVNWIADEIKDTLYFNNVSKEMGLDNIKLSLNSTEIDEYPIFDKHGIEKKKLAKNLMISLLEKGCIQHNIENDKNGNNIPQSWINHFYKSFVLVDTNINEKFAALSSLSSSSFTHDAHQFLTLGVILKREDDILLCIQPSCDSFRLKKMTRFIFLKVEKNSENFDLVVPEGKNYQKLAIINKTDNIELISFDPSNGIVISGTDNNDEVFEDISGTKYKWIANLKYPFAQRIANAFAYEISRVGLDESEWLRKRSGN